MTQFKRGNTRARKLQREDVRQIREMYALGRYSYGQLALQFDVAINTIANIVKGYTWRDGPGRELVDRPAVREADLVLKPAAESDIEASLARLQAKLAQPDTPSLYENPPPTADHELSDSAAEKFSKALGAPSVSEELDGLIK